MEAIGNQIKHTKGLLIDPLKKSVSSIDVAPDLIATFLGSESVVVSTILQNGDMLYSDPAAISLQVNPFKIDDLGVFYGKAVYVSTHKNGQFKDTEITPAQIFSSIVFQEDSVIEWFRGFLNDDGIAMNHMIQRDDGRMISVQSVLNTIAMLPENKKNEIRMLAVIDNANAINKMNLITHLANTMEVNDA
ncbi:MAG: hypothetical protein M1300_11085 [Epsilonproteobacteria bacterium]|nr:hypothetical protein [Campylobacterota bacterium]